MRTRTLLGATVLALSTMTMTVTAATAAGASESEASRADFSSDAPQHVFYVMMENHGYNQIIGNTADAPFINALASRYNLATNFHGVTHPSLPNYLAAISGSTQGIFDDCKAGATVTCAPEEFVPGSGDATSSASLTPAQAQQAAQTPHMFGGRTIVDQLEKHGLSWKAYMENLPSSGSQVEYAPVVNGQTVKLYAQKHDPFMYFSSINSPFNERLNNIVPLEGHLSHDLAEGTVPNFVWISPNQCHDMHGISASSAALVGLPQCGYPSDPTVLDHGAIQLGDAFVKQTVKQIMASKTWRTTRSQIVLSWDENDYSGYSGGPGSPVGAKGVVLGGGTAASIVISSHAGPHKTSDALLDHYSVLRAIQDEWHLGCLAATCDLRGDQRMTGLFRP